MKDILQRPEMEEVTVVVINFNGEQHLDECLRSVRAADGPIREVILVDDCSTDDSVAFVQKQFPWVRVIKLSQNQGPSVARNTGIDSAQTQWVLLLDNDIVVDKTWLTPLLETMRDREEVIACSSRIVTYENPEIIGEDGLEAHYVGMPTRRNPGRLKSEIPEAGAQEVGSLAGISIMVSKERMQKAAYFDPDFFYSFEDMDFCLRNRMLGYRCMVVPQSIVYHKYITGGVTGLSDSQSGYPARRAYYVFRNRWYIIAEFYAIRTLITLAPALIFFEFLTLLFAVRRRVFRSYVRACKSFTRNLSGIVGKRRVIQEARLVPDRKLLSAFPLTLGHGTAQGRFEKGLIASLNFFFRRYWLAVRCLL